jgi:hypothetical protein
VAICLCLDCSSHGQPFYSFDFFLDLRVFKMSLKLQRFFTCLFWVACAHKPWSWGSMLPDCSDDSSAAIELLPAHHVSSSPSNYLPCPSFTGVLLVFCSMLFIRRSWSTDSHSLDWDLAGKDDMLPLLLSSLLSMLALGQLILPRFLLGGHGDHD